MPGSRGGGIPSNIAKESEGNLATLLLETRGGTWCDLSAAGGELAFTDSSSPTSALTPGNYLICADQHCHVRTGAAGVVTAAVTDFYLPQNTPLGIVIDTTNNAIAAIRETSSGSLWYTRVPARVL